MSFFFGLSGKLTGDDLLMFTFIQPWQISRAVVYNHRYISLRRSEHHRRGDFTGAKSMKECTDLLRAVILRMRGHLLFKSDEGICLIETAPCWEGSHCRVHSIALYQPLRSFFFVWFTQFAHATTSVDKNVSWVLKDYVPLKTWQWNTNCVIRLKLSRQALKMQVYSNAPWEISYIGLSEVEKVQLLPFTTNFSN